MLSEKNNLTIITIHKGSFYNLKKTLSSIDSQIIKVSKHIVVANGINNFQINCLKKKYRTFLLNRDSSIYNAMNLGLSDKSVKNNNFIFLNSGDKLSNKMVTYRLKNYLKLNICLVGKVDLKFKINKYLIKDKFFFKDNYFPHCGFISPPLNLPGYKKNLYMYDEKRLIDADSLWIKKIINLKKKKIKKLNFSISQHALSGISSNPSIFSMKYYFSIKKFFFIKELIKFILLKFLGYMNYYKLIYFYKYNIRTNND